MTAQGNQFRSQKRIVIGFDPETFEQIALRAKRRRHSFAEEVRTLVEWSLELDNAA